MTNAPKMTQMQSYIQFHRRERMRAKSRCSGEESHLELSQAHVTFRSHFTSALRQYARTARSSRTPTSWPSCVLHFGLGWLNRLGKMLVSSSQETPSEDLQERIRQFEAAIFRYRPRSDSGGDELRDKERQ